MAPHDRDAAADTGRCVYAGCLCCYAACDFTNPLLLCKGSCDFICLRHACCLALNTPTRGCGCTGDSRRGEFCKVGCLCFDVGFVVPTKVCSGGCQFCCCFDVISLPCAPEYIPCPGILTLWCIPGCCCLQICPRCGCCVAPPPCPALDKFLHDNEDMAPLNMEMDDRGQANNKPAPPAPTQPPAREQAQVIKAVAAPSIPKPAPPPPQPSHSSSVVIATGTKNTAHTKVGMSLRTKDGHVVIKTLKPDSIFAHDSVVKEGMTVKRINGQAVRTADEAVAILQQAVGSITLECKEAKKKSNYKNKKHHDDEHQKGHHHHKQSKNNQQEKAQAPMKDEIMVEPEGTYIVDL